MNDRIEAAECILEDSDEARELVYDIVQAWLDAGQPLYRIGSNFAWIVNIKVPVGRPDEIGEYTKRLVEADVLERVVSP